MAQLQPAPKRERVLSYVTPKVADVIFYELRDSRIPANKSFTYGDAHPDAYNYPNHQLVYVSPASQDGWQKWVYAAVRGNQNDYNFEVTAIQGYSSGWDTGTRTYVIKRSEFLDGSWIATYDTPSNSGGTWSLSSYSLVGHAGDFRCIRIEDAELDSLFVVIQYTFVETDTYTDKVLNEETGEIEDVTRTLSQSQTAASVDANGDFTESRQLNHRYYLSTTRSAKPFDSRTWETTEPFYWPPVLIGVPELTTIYDSNGRALKGLVNSNIREAYNGYCRVSITEEWTKEQPDITLPTVPLPSAIDHDVAFIDFRLPPCLHIGLTVTEIVGADHPTYQSGNYSKTYPATNMTDWPFDNGVTFERVRPYRGGYIKTAKTYYPPSV